MGGGTFGLIPYFCTLNVAAYRTSHHFWGYKPNFGGKKNPLQRVNGNAAGIRSKVWVQHGFDTPRAWTEDLVPRSSMENVNVT